MKAERGDEALRRFRISQPGADYFITANLVGKPLAELRSASRDEIRREVVAIETAGHWRIRAAVITPDHLHLLLTLGHSLDLSRAMARLKTKTRPPLLRQGVQWQANFYEHRLRAGENPTEVIRYIFLNPYRAKLIGPEEVYSWYWTGSGETVWFESQTDGGHPPPEWLR